MAFEDLGQLRKPIPVTIDTAECQSSQNIVYSWKCPSCHIKGVYCPPGSSQEGHSKAPCLVSTDVQVTHFSIHNMTLSTELHHPHDANFTTILTHCMG